MCIVVEQSQSLPQQPAPTEAEKYASEKQFRRRYLCSQWTIVGVTIGIAVIAWCNLRAINKTLHEATRQTSIAVEQAKSTKMAADAAHDAALAAIAGARGWMIPVNIAPPSPNKLTPKSMMPIQFKNIGKSPAMDLELTQEFAYVTLRPNEDTRDRFHGCPAEGKEVFHSGAVSVDATPWLWHEPINVARADIRNIVERKGILLIHACLKYRTIFGTAFTDYCVMAYNDPAHPDTTAPCYPTSLELR